MKRVILVIGLGLINVGYAKAQDSLFAPAVNHIVSNAPFGIVAADLDDDGNIDLAVTSDSANMVTILKNNGNGVFQIFSYYSINYMPRGIAADDLDNDGDNDLAIANLGGSVAVLKNNGNGTFQDAVYYQTVTFTEGIDIADLDGDGDKDLVSVNPGFMSSGNYSIILNNGDGTFQAPINNGASSGVCSVVAEDFDGDNDNDLAFAVGSFSGNVSVLINNGNATFQGVNYPTGFFSSSVFAADFDGDNDKDLAVTNAFSNNVSILMNDGNAIFQAAVNYQVGNVPMSVVAANLDGDGDKDLAVANDSSNNVSILLNNGSGVFQSAGTYATGAQPITVVVADFDNDGDNDLAVTNYISDNISILINRTAETGIGDFDGTNRPSAVSLAQNYPNPFNAQTTIQYSLAEQASVSIDIFDISGRKIETIAQGAKPAGTYQAVWDAGSQSSGIYFYRIKAGDRVEAKKMLLVK